MSSIGAALWTVSCYSLRGCSKQLSQPQVSNGQGLASTSIAINTPHLQSVNILTALSCDTALQKLSRTDLSVSSRQTHGKQQNLC